MNRTGTPLPERPRSSESAIDAREALGATGCPGDMGASLLGGSRAERGRGWWFEGSKASHPELARVGEGGWHPTLDIS